MHRTNLIINVQLLREAQELSGKKTITSTIHHALMHFISDTKRKKKIARLRKLRGSKMWEGDLSQLRLKRIK